mgnify:CR=1 FL=1
MQYSSLWPWAPAGCHYLAPAGASLTCCCTRLNSLGLLPALMDRELMMGMKMPPALAVVDGMAGAISASATDNPYARPRVLFPKSFTKMVATRSPSPVFSKPCRGWNSQPRLQTCVTPVVDPYTHFGSLVQRLQAAGWAGKFSQ